MSDDGAPSASGRGSRFRVTRRSVLIGLGATALAGRSAAAYAVGIEPMRFGVPPEIVVVELSDRDGDV